MEKVTGKGYFPHREFSDLREMIFQSFDNFKDYPAYKFRYNSNDSVCVKKYSDVKDDLINLGTSLSSSNLCGEKICVLSDNSYNWALCYLTLICAGCIGVPLDAKLTDVEIISSLQRSEASAVFFHDKFLPIMTEYARENDHIKKYICISYDNVDFSDINDDRFIHINDFSELGRTAEPTVTESFLNVKINPQALAFLLFTSGTTSFSKAVMLSQHNIATDIKGVISFVQLEPNDHLLSVLPLHHTFENTCGLLIPLYFGACVAYNDGLKYIGKNMKEYKVKAMILVPMLLENIHSKLIAGIKKKRKYTQYRLAVMLSGILRKFNIDIRNKVFADIREQFGGNLAFAVSGAAPLSPSISKSFEQIGIRIIQGYGLTETSPVIAGCNFVIQEHGTAGHPLPGVEIMIDNDHPGEVGEICVKGDNVMLGYMDNSEATAEVIDADGWFHTGDLGRLTRKGNLQITGRVKSMIVLKNGKKVFPEELEYLINGLSYIKESMVFGEVEDVDDVLICARLTLNADTVKEKLGDNYTDNDITALLTADIKSINRQMPSYKHIRYTFFGFEELPKTTTLKIKRHLGYRDFKEVLTRAALSLKEAAYKNFDKLKESLNNRSKK